MGSKKKIQPVWFPVNAVIEKNLSLILSVVSHKILNSRKNKFIRIFTLGPGSILGPIPSQLFKIKVPESFSNLTVLNMKDST